MSLARYRLSTLAAPAAGLLLLAASALPAAAQAPGTGGVLVSQDTNVSGLVGEVTECKRKEGVLTIKVRFRNTGTEEATFRLIDGNYDAQYATAANKKYFVLRDTEKVPLASEVDQQYLSVDPGATWTWWAKYPAPPADVKSVSYYMSVAPPFEDIPITDQ